MKRAGTGGTLAVVAVVLMMTLSGCAGWGASADGGVVEGANEPDEPDAGNEADAEGDGASTTGAGATAEDDASLDASRTSDPEPSDESGSANDADNGAADGGGGADVDEDTGTSDADESGASDGGSVDEDETTNVTDDGTTDDATVDDGETDSEDGTQPDEGTVEADDDGGDEEAEADEPVQEYDSSQFTFTAIAYGDDEERLPHSVDVWNTHGRSIDLSGWTVTTTEGWEYVFPEGTTVGSDGTVTVQFGPAELTRDGGTLTLIDARGNAVIEDEYGD